MAITIKTYFDIDRDMGDLISFCETISKRVKKECETTYTKEQYIRDLIDLRKFLNQKIKNQREN